MGLSAIHTLRHHWSVRMGDRPVRRFFEAVNTRRHRMDATGFVSAALLVALVPPGDALWVASLLGAILCAGTLARDVWVALR